MLQSVRRSAFQRALYRDRKLVLALILAVCLLLFYALRYWYLPSYAPIIGSARVIDGDTIQIAGRRIRLEGIDAPETDQTCVDASGRTWLCGRNATQELITLVRDQELTCRPHGLDRYRRVLAVCSLPDGADVNGWMVRQGWAIVSGYTSGYRFEEHDARAAKRGLWAGSFDPPRAWRARHAM